MTTELASMLSALNDSEQLEARDFLNHLLMEKHLPVPEEHRALIRERVQEARQNPNDETSVAEFMAEKW
jgi:hypothetical protein